MTKPTTSTTHEKNKNRRSRRHRRRIVFSSKDGASAGASAGTSAGASAGASSCISPPPLSSSSSNDSTTNSFRTTAAAVTTPSNAADANGAIHENDCNFTETKDFMNDTTILDEKSQKRNDSENGNFDFDETTFDEYTPKRDYKKDGAADSNGTGQIFRSRVKRRRRKMKFNVKKEASTAMSSPFSLNDKDNDDDDVFDISTFETPPRHFSKTHYGESESKRKAYGCCQTPPSSSSSPMNLKSQNNDSSPLLFSPTASSSKRTKTKHRFPSPSEEQEKNENCNFLQQNLPTLLHQREIFGNSTLALRKHLVYAASSRNNSNVSRRHKNNSNNCNNLSLLLSSSNNYNLWKTLFTKYLPLSKDINLSTSTVNTKNFGNVISNRQRLQWRTYTQKKLITKIPFSMLETPITDAVLALDRNGLFMISLGNGCIHRNRGSRADDSGGGCFPILALSFYGVPSPDSLLKRNSPPKSNKSNNNAERVVSPLLLTVPLLLDNADQDDNQNFTAPTSVLGDIPGISSAAPNTPVKILISSDSALGVAFLLHSSSSSSDHSAPMIPAPALVSSPAVREEDILGTLILFQLPSSSILRTNQQIRCQQLSSWSSTSNGEYANHQSAFIKTYKCANVRLGGWNAFTMRNLLWPTKIIPYKTTTNDANSISDEYALCDMFMETSAYILFNDEDDGYRITWIVFPIADSGGLVPHTPRRTKDMMSSTKAFKVQPERHDIVTVTDENVWEEFWSNSRTGHVASQITPDKVANDRHFEVGFEAYLHVDALLSDLLLRRRKILSPNFFTGDVDEEIVALRGLPDFFYNLISVSTDGRVLTVVIVFGNGQGLGMANYSAKGKHPKSPAAFGVFLRLDLFNQSYEEDEWVQHPSRYDTVFLRHWSNTLALNHRMKEMNAGVFCLGQGGGVSMKGGGSLPTGVNSHESNTGEDEADDRNPDIWRNYATKAGSKTGCKIEPPKEIAMSYLYPHSELVTNRAVINCKPVSKISCRNSPIELCYG